MVASLVELFILCLFFFCYVTTIPLLCLLCYHPPLSRMLLLLLPLIPVLSFLPRPFICLCDRTVAPPKNGAIQDNPS